MIILVMSVWKFEKFTAIQILRENNFDSSEFVQFLSGEIN